MMHCVIDILLEFRSNSVYNNFSSSPIHYTVCLAFLFAGDFWIWTVFNSDKIVCRHIICQQALSHTGIAAYMRGYQELKSETTIRVHSMLSVNHMGSRISIGVQPIFFEGDWAIFARNFFWQPPKKLLCWIAKLLCPTYPHPFRAFYLTRQNEFHFMAARQLAGRRPLYFTERI